MDATALGKFLYVLAVPVDSEYYDMDVRVTGDQGINDVHRWFGVLGIDIEGHEIQLTSEITEAFPVEGSVGVIHCMTFLGEDAAAIGAEGIIIVYDKNVHNVLPCECDGVLSG